MTPDKNEELLDSTPMNRRSMLKRVLIGGAVVYTAPVVATFALNGSQASAGFLGGTNQTFGSNLSFGDHEWDGFDWGDPFVEETPTPEPTPEPTPTVAPTTAPKKYDKPKSGGGAAPTFTG